MFTTCPTHTKLSQLLAPCSILHGRQSQQECTCMYAYNISVINPWRWRQVLHSPTNSSLHLARVTNNIRHTTTQPYIQHRSIRTSFTTPIFHLIITREILPLRRQVYIEGALTAWVQHLGKLRDWSWIFWRHWREKGLYKPCSLGYSTWIRLDSRDDSTQV